MAGVAGAAMALLAAPARADHREEAARWTFGGFGSAALTHSNERQANFTASVLNPGRAGRDRRWSADVDSRLGAQLGVELDAHWSAVLQVVAERAPTHDYAPRVEWANVKYQATPDLGVRVGRIASPLFLAGDYRKAGYALPWVRPPVEMYGAMPISHSDGVDAAYRWTLGDVKNRTQVFAGRTRQEVQDDRYAKARGIAGLSNTATRGPLSVRAVLLRASVSVDLTRPLSDGLRRFGPAGAALAGRYELIDKRTTAGSVGASYDPGDWFLMAEVARINTRSFVGDRTAGYVSGGYRLGAWAPYATRAMVRANTATAIAGLPLEGLPPGAAAAAAALNAGLNAALRGVGAQSTASAGVRWDFLPSAALKLQYDRVRPRDGTNGMLIDVQPGFRSDRAFGVTSVSLDFVF